MKTARKGVQPQQHYLKKLLMTPQLDRHSETIREWEKVIMGLGATLPNHIPACRSEFCSNLISKQNVRLLSKVDFH